MGQTYGISKNCYIAWVSNLKLCPADAPNTKARRIQPFIQAFNDLRDKLIAAGLEVTIDESMSEFCPLLREHP